MQNAIALKQYPSCSYPTGFGNVSWNNLTEPNFEMKFEKTLSVKKTGN